VNFIIGFSLVKIASTPPSNIMIRGKMLITYPQKLALTWPTSGGRSVGVVRSPTQATEFSFF
jgi:hypothetical protein